MNESRYLGILLLLIFSFNILNAKVKILEKSASHKPDWIKEIPVGYEYDYFNGTGYSDISYTKAKNGAICDAINRIAEKKEVEITSKIYDKLSEINSTVDAVVSREILTKILPTKLQGTEEVKSYYCKFEENNKIKYEWYILIRIPKDPEDRITSPTKFTYLWRSAVLPGWGQLYKKEKIKGLSIFLFEGLSLASGYLTYQKCVDYNNKANMSSNPSDKEWYNDQRDKYYYISLCSFVVAGGAYIYNIIDAISFKGENVYANNKFELLIDSSNIMISYKF